jgi:hypothetical protein
MCACPCPQSFWITSAGGGVSIGGSALCKSNPAHYQGSGGAICGGTATVDVPSQVFGNYAGVYHLVEKSVGATGEYADSSTCHNKATGEKTTPNSAYPVRTQSSLYGFCQTLSAQNYINTENLDACRNNGPITVSLWFNPSGQFLYSRCVFSRGLTNRVTGEGISLSIGYYVTGTAWATVTTSDGTLYTLNGVADLTLGCWTHAALVWVPGVSATLYINGAVDATTSVLETTLMPATTVDQFGRSDRGLPYIGQLQELRILPLAASASWIETEFTNLCQQGWSNGSVTNPLAGS